MLTYGPCFPRVRACRLAGQGPLQNVSLVFGRILQEPCPEQTLGLRPVLLWPSVEYPGTASLLAHLAAVDDSAAPSGGGIAHDRFTGTRKLVIDLYERCWNPRLPCLSLCGSPAAALHPLATSPHRHRYQLRHIPSDS